MRASFDATLAAVLLVTGVVSAATILGVATGPVGADEHTRATAERYDDLANFTIVLPSTTDHYPGNQNQQNGSIWYFAAGEAAFDEIGAPDGAFIHTIILDADWIDYTACDPVQNTRAFGIDRGNNDSGVQYDDDLVSRMKDNRLESDGLTVWFYTWSDFGGDPPYMAPEDAIVAAQGAGSGSGPCLTVTSEPGWYQIQGFMNGTEADNGPDEAPSESADHAGIVVASNYVYVCECENEQQAREELGPPPSERGGGTATPAPTPTPGDAGDAAPTPTPTEPPDRSTSTPTRSPRHSTPTQTQPSAMTTRTGGAGGGGGGGGNTGGGGGSGGLGTPTPGAGPGFGALAALSGLLVTAVLLHRRP